MNPDTRFNGMYTKSSRNNNLWLYQTAEKVWYLRVHKDYRIEDYRLQIKLWSTYIYMYCVHILYILKYVYIYYVSKVSWYRFHN